MFEDKMGFNQHLLCDDPDTRQGCLNWLERVRAAFGDEPCVDVQVIEGELVLNEATAGYIYSDFTCMDSNYVPGSRPFLEKVLAETIGLEMTQREKFLAIMRRCRDNREARRAEISFDGGTEEELIKRGTITCNEISRVFVVLCQMAGIPARLTCTHIYGHMMGEAFVDGRWAWCDPRYGNYAYKDGGTLASFWDMARDPALIDRQDRSVWDDCKPSYEGKAVVAAFDDLHKAHRQTLIRECTFHPKEAFAIGNYYVWNHAKYDYPWHATAPSDSVRQEAIVRTEMAMRMKFGYPPAFWNPRCQVEPLRVNA
ncbi:hypothetical protein LCGC14_1230350 [marine sediment metagenome]|uniref:Transglutaminase-like domain-containing protein n=1 Tax=marine sediment metagenome TaxID=412755 RepID=A0A0F9NR32_9ZZZZ